jgi:hypothetical protein
LQLFDQQLAAVVERPQVEGPPPEPGDDRLLFDEVVEAGGVEVGVGQPCAERVLGDPEALQRAPSFVGDLVGADLDAEVLGDDDEQVALEGALEVPLEVRSWGATSLTSW